jgi:hypothetical protein
VWEHFSTLGLLNVKGLYLDRGHKCYVNLFTAACRFLGNRCCWKLTNIINDLRVVVLGECDGQLKQAGMCAAALLGAQENLVFIACTLVTSGDASTVGMV